MIDIHVHLYPDALAERTLEALAKTAGGGSSIPVYTDATATGTREKLAQWGVRLGVVMNIATSAHSMRKVNDFASETQGKGLLCFGSVHPEAKDAVEEIARIKNLGLHGVKLHPVYQGFAADDPKMGGIYEAIEKSGLPVTFHAGFDPAAPDSDFASPTRIAAVAKAYPSLQVIAAHLGGLHRWEEAEKTLLAMKNVYLDTAMLAMCWKRSKERLVSMIRTHGVKRVLFGSDCPYSSPEKEARLIREIGLREDEIEMILEENACGLLNIGRETLP